ncbi:type VII secretion-associated serine protease mycosin [Glaciihabitans tibetensis]|uniref:Type VII secretion-associated serine protease mycosin n=1 Tax=Glaciihabitans tibetensis TaxID=1266600 RepID=A0A2T0V4H5_9MICO|nr:S8 family serine peptidase [Glaciihabitans tibetensis]PRY65027.1 type VII secretion-associated serine protease mycosin [Glaciihabitans tibetensis]
MKRRAGAAIAVLAVVASVFTSAAPASADYIRDGEYWLNDYGITEAWNTTRGAGVTIAVIDTGIDSSHPDLAGAVTGGADFSGLGASDGQSPVGSSSESNHGTMVASLAAGRGNAPGAGVIGVAPEANLLSISIGFGENATDSDDQVAEAVTWAVDNGADIINMSLTRNTLSWPASWDAAFLYASEHDVVVVAAAGNRGSGTTSVGAPATMPGVLTVAGVDQDGEASLDASAQGITIGVSAPSEQLLGAIPGGSVMRWSGTSGATPIVAGIVALVMAAHPELDASNVINRVVSTARPAGAQGSDPIYGFGLVDAAAAVTADVAGVTANPMGDLAEWIRLNRRAVATAEPTVPPVETTSPEAPSLELAGPQNPLGTLYPTVTELRMVGLPLAIVGIFGTLFGVFVLLASRQFRAVRRRE